MAGGINRFNRISSKEWLPFQKSWFRYTGDLDWIRTNMRFFTKKEEGDEQVYYHGPNSEIAKAEAGALGFEAVQEAPFSANALQFAFLDFRSEVEHLAPENWPALRENIVTVARAIFDALCHRRFLMVALPNGYSDGKYHPYAWELALHLGGFFTLKDEKIAGVGGDQSGGDHFYCLYFRKDENSGVHRTAPKIFTAAKAENELLKKDIPSWFILKPQRRNKKEILHPAKFPEELATMFIEKLCPRGGNVFDPMSGTGSTQLAALALGRNGYGTELSAFFADIARERCLALLFERSKEKPLDQLPEMEILEADARRAAKLGFPQQDLIFTSPPYWDMLNMKGAENQAKRVEKGLRTNYSDDVYDLGNIAAYDDFVADLAEIYFDLLALLKPGGHIVMVVKNIKKKGKNYPFAWDLSWRLREKLDQLPTLFWCQDDISIAPYGYGNTFVSNTFHQYCLVFKKPQPPK